MYTVIVTVEPDTNEDTDSIEQHQQVMQAECRKLQPDDGIFSDRMARTFSDRRSMTTTSTVAAILEKYPCLPYDSQLTAEIDRLKGVNVYNSIATCITIERAELILNAVRDRKAAGNFKSSIAKLSNLDLNSQKRHCALMLLPLLFAESIEEWFVMNKEPKHSTPAIAASGDLCDLFGPVNRMSLVTKVDGIEISHPTEILQAVCSVLCLYWVFDIQYSKKLRKTLTFLASHVCGLKSVRLVLQCSVA